MAALKYTLTAIMAGTAAVGFAQGDPAHLAQTPLEWAYAVNTPGVELPTDDGRVHRVPGSSEGFTWSEVRNLYRPPDWHPDDHPPMPDIVARGREPDVFACGYCHLPNGQGRPENSSLAGLPADYIIQQMTDYRDGLRRSTEPRMLPPAAMLTIGMNATPQEVEVAAQYFSQLIPRRWIRVVETDTVPETIVAGWMYVPVQGENTEPIGQRILEMPEDLERTELRDFRSSFIAYVPTGSVARGERLVGTGGDSRTIACSVCHGPNLRGLGPVPPLAGRSPSYIARQLFDLKTGNRRGSWSALMQAAVEHLSVDDIIAISAYIASMEP